MRAGGAIWNLTRSLAETMPRDRMRESGLRRREANDRDRQYAHEEERQLVWCPAPGRLPYAGHEGAREE
jgi:hypothetical protein